MPLLSLLVAVGLVAGCAADPAPPPTNGQGARLTASDPEHRPGATAARLDLALLQADGLGAGWQQSPHPPEPPPWPWLQADCPAYREADYPAQRHRTGAVQRRYLHAASEQVATQVVEAYEPGWAAKALDDVRRVVDTCPRYDAYGSTISFTLLDTELPPEAGLAVQGRIESPGAPARSTLLVAVRHDDRISTLNVPGPVDRGTAHQVAKKLGDLLD
ncbi:hypothetical protein [Plantactinospora endophytica]|uniref:Sensor domain-containing protein n=1 Tax=Plantactinospora endophytica TaxID=673535 RepID=A0ABQ4EDL0_9ACTN|nr:hypothetical protein [Plantactinospora endophytica]GIG92749.1 hypothetical protein Pen02_76850 [Plantactinospora endophytica]